MTAWLKAPYLRSTVALGLWIAIALALLVWIAVHHHNRFVTLENRCDESWSNVDAELTRRHALIPNLVAAVKGYAQHEGSVIKEVARARSAAVDALQGGDHAGKAEQRLVAATGRLLAVAEANPELKASKNFLQLQQELAITEDRIQAARRFYNGNVRDHRNATGQFPGVLFAAVYRPARQDFFEADPVHVHAPVVAT